MKNPVLIIIAFIAFAGTINAQKSDLNGIWKLTETLQYGDKAHTTSTFLNIQKSGVIEVSGRDVGTWEKSESGNTLTINCDQFDGIGGENKIETLDEKELKLINSNGDITILERISLPENKKLTNKFTGEWLLEKLETNGKTEFLGQIVELGCNGIFYIQGFVFGKWDYDKASKKLVFDVKEDFNGEHTILKSNEASFIIDFEGAKMYFSKIDREKIVKENSTSGLLGTWEIENTTNTEGRIFIAFTTPDELEYVIKSEYSQEKGGAMWIFKKEEMMLTIIGFRGKNMPGGESKIIKLEDNTLELENNGTIFSLKKEKKLAVEIERLTYSYEEFFTENGDFKYEADYEKLPWKDPLETIMTLANVKQLVYKYSTLIENTKSFEVETLTANVNSNPQEQELSIDFIFNGYDRNNLPNDSALPPNEFKQLYGFTYNELYPEEENSYRVAGSEQITTPAGTFDCIVVEVVIDDEARKKLWMIKNKPGIYAKIIDDKSGNWGHYHIYELQEIR